MLPWSTELRGRLDEHVIVSELLRGNPLGDPHERPLWVYVPPGYEDDADRRYPSVYVIQGLTGQLDMWRNRTAFRPNFLELVDELAAPCVVVFVDAWTSLGGSQFIDSRGTGRYGSYFCDEVVAFVDERYRTLPEAAHRGIMGKSSGGYGAMVNAMLRPDRFGGFATHAGDALFEVSYLPEFRTSVRALRDHYEGSFERFWEDFRSRPAFSKKTDHVLLNDWCMAACYSTDEMGPSTSRTGWTPAGSSRRCGSGGSPGIRSGWHPGMRKLFAACGRSTSTRAAGTSPTSTSARRPFGRSSRPWASPTSSSSSSTPGTATSSTAIP
jgi:hypothetical protein